MQLTLISSSANPRLKHTQRLRESRYRRRSGEFIVDGIREMRRALDAGIPLIALFAERTRWLNWLGAEHFSDQLEREDLEKLCDHLGQEWLPALNTGRLQGNVVSDTLFEKILYGERNDGIVAVFQTPGFPLDALSPPPNPLVVVLDRIEKPGNVGAILRSADAAGVDAVLLVECGTDLLNPNVIRASCGTVFNPRIAVATLHDAQTWLLSHNLHTLALRVDATTELWEKELREGVAFLVGNEAQGLGERWRATEIEGVCLPMLGSADSLNASVTTAICLFEAVRQRRNPPAAGASPRKL